MSPIETCHAIEVLDSRGNPTLKVTITTKDGFSGSAIVPSGASTGQNEAVELRDCDLGRYRGKGVLKAVANVKGPLFNCIKGRSIFHQKEIDEAMIELDGTSNKGKLGANAILGISMASAKCAAAAKKIPLYKYLGGNRATLLPCPMMNIINGGVHADSGLDFQEFMIRPIGAKSFKEALQWGTETFHALKQLLLRKGLSTSVGDEGGFAPALMENEEACELILEAIEKAGYRPKEQITLALDCAASEFYEEGFYLEKKKKLKGKTFLKRNAEEQTKYLAELAHKYPIDSIEDPLDENDWAGWTHLTKTLGKKIQLIGDDIFVTNTTFLRKGIHEKSANGILIKPNQIGTLTETKKAIELAKENHFLTVMSHRSGETEDTTIADLSVAYETGQIKTGSLSRSDRVAKYNRLLEIEEELGSSAQFYR